MSGRTVIYIVSAVYLACLLLGLIVNSKLF